MRTDRPSYGPITLYGLWAPVKVDLDRSIRSSNDAPKRHIPRGREGPSVQRRALPVSFAITKGITVVFFSSAY